MSDIIEEVIIDHKEENKIKQFKLALFVACGITIFIIFCMGIWSVRAKSAIEHSQKMSDMLVQAMGDANDHTVDIEALEHIINNSNSDITDLALLAKARIMLTEKAQRHNKVEIFETIGMSSKNDITKLYGRIMWMSILLDKNSHEMTDHERKTLQMFVDSFNKDTVPFYGSSAILKAALDIKYTNDTTEAQHVIDQLLASGKALPLIRDQAQALITNLNFSKGLTK